MQPFYVNDASVTGGAYDFSKATTSLTQKLLSSPKQVTLVRHGLSTWNDESRVQVSRFLSNLISPYMLFPLIMSSIMHLGKHKFVDIDRNRNHASRKMQESFGRYSV